MLIDVDKALELGISPCKVYCDGKEIPLVIEMDCEEGYLVAYESDHNGKLIENSRGEVKQITHRGEITYEKTDW